MRVASATSSHKTLLLLAAVTGLCCQSASAADERPSLGAILNHDHQPIMVRSRPVIERLPLKVIEPVDLKISVRGDVFVADRHAGCVFRIDTQGNTALMADNLPGIERIDVSEQNSIFALTKSGGESALHQITSGGQQIVVSTFGFPASTFVRDAVGNFYLATENSGRIVLFSADGEISEFSVANQPTIDLALNAGGQLEALFPGGILLRFSPDGTSIRSGFAELGSSRLSSLQDGTLLTLARSADGHPLVCHVARSLERPESFRVAARVSIGTRAVGFDALGNLCIANPDLRAVTKVTSHFRIPCPHCGRDTRMIFSLDHAPAEENKSREF